jgi:uncharacterized membrane protein (UPF0127 family)
MKTCRRAQLTFLLILLLTLLSCGREGQQETSPQTDQTLPSDSSTEVVVIEVAGHPVRVRISETPRERQRGLMFTDSLPPDEGMLFVFEREQILSFWMKNTPLPLSVAFIDTEGRILEIKHMQPLDEGTRHTSKQPALYALEMNAGWFEKHGVRVGDRVEF